MKNNGTGYDSEHSYDSSLQSHFFDQQETILHKLLIRFLRLYSLSVHQECR